VPGARLILRDDKYHIPPAGASVAHVKAIQSLSKLKRTSGGIIRFPEVFHALSWLLHLNKQESWKFLAELEQLGLIRVVWGHGIRILENGGADDAERRERRN